MIQTKFITAPKVNTFTPKHGVTDKPFTRGAVSFIRTKLPLNTSGIYVIQSSVNGKIYVGSAVNLRRRKREHFRYLRNNKHENSRLQNHYNKYGEMLIFGIIELIPIKKQLIKREQYWFDKLKLFTADERPLEFNICPNANSTLGKKVSEKIKAKLKKIRGWKSIDQYDLKGNYIATYNGVSDASKQTRINLSDISMCANINSTSSWNKHIKSAGKFLWIHNGKSIDKTLKEYNKSKKNVNYNTKPRIVYQYDLKGNFIAEYPSIYQAAKQSKTNKFSIFGCINHPDKHQTAGGFKWKTIFQTMRRTK